MNAVAEGGVTDVVDLVGSPFSVLESDPGLFTMLLQKLGVQGLEVTEVYEIAPWAVDHLSPRGLIFCYLCQEDAEGDEAAAYDSPDSDAENVWFAHQLSDDACASQALLNIIFNCENVELGEDLSSFYADTRKMSPEMKGLAITNSNFILNAHNSFARPVDIRASYHGAATKASEYAKRKTSAASANQRQNIKSMGKRKTVPRKDDKQDSYHFIGYVQCGGKVWELDGLRFSGPLEVGETPSASDWMDVVRPALKMRMQRYASGVDRASDNIRYSLLAIVEDKYRKASDELEMLKRERGALERRLQEIHPDGWSVYVDRSLYECAAEIFATSVQPSSNGPTFSRDFGARKMERELAILDMPARKVFSAWQECVRAAMALKVTIEEEVEKSKTANVEHINRTFDYEPLIQSFVTSMHNEGILDEILNPPKAKKVKR